MLFAETIRKKRDGAELDRSEIEHFVAGLADASIPPAQVAALAMAIYLRSMTATETGTLTRCMAASGTQLQWDPERLGGPVVDKHSTGGVGDKSSFLLAPIVAACGGFVPMISGRGLGHSGGTVDKLSSIPGVSTTPSRAEFERIVAEVGCAIIGQTADLAPADRRLYAIRDITATIESVPLITASILSKKMAAGIGTLVMDVKVGSGAFMSEMERARELSRSVIETAAAAGLPAHTLITDMNEILGTTAGNALEIAECVRILRGETAESRLMAVTLGLAAEMLLISGLADSPAAAERKAGEALASGAAAAVFGRMIAALGGPADFVERCDAYLPVAPVTQAVAAPRAGFLASVDARALGNTIVTLGGGRQSVDDELDLRVGFSFVRAIGAGIAEGEPLALVHAATPEAAQQAIHSYINACTITDTAPTARPVIYDTLRND